MLEKENSSDNKTRKSSLEDNKDRSENDLLKDLTKKHAVYCKDLVKDFEIGDYIVRAVDNVSLSIYNGEFLVIKGPSGAGKTSLLNLIGGLDTPNSGIIYSFGVKISDMEQESLTTWRLLNS